VIDVDTVGVAEGSKIVIDKVLFIEDKGKVTFGDPFIKGAKVKATSQGDFKGEKILVFNYKPKVRHNVKRGHRQQFTRLAIDRISPPASRKKTTETGEEKKNGS
jgi:large subunit ribosomal protein L21